MVQININFTNNPHGVYYSGQNLSGEIEIHNEKTRKIRCITMEIEGFAECKWSESEGSGKTRRTTTYRGYESYLKTHTFLLGTMQTDGIELSAGKHNYNFSCHLPINLPTSFESQYGQIRYQVKVKIDRPWKTDIKQKFGFTVIRVTDLNYVQPSLRLPVKSEISKSFFLGLSGKELSMTAEIPASGFVSGQPLNVSVRVNNASKVDIENLKISLKQIIHCNSQSPRRKTKELIMSFAPTRYDGVKAKDKGSLEATLMIPPVAPTNFGTCSIVEVFYEIHVLAKVGGIHRSPVIRLPVTIGTVPLFDAPSAYLPVPPPNMNFNQQPGPSSHPPAYPNLASAPNMSPENLPPPSYEMAMGMTSESNDSKTEEGLNYEENPFNPRYPVYNFAHSPYGNSAAPLANQNALRPPAPYYGFNAGLNENQEKKS